MLLLAILTLCSTRSISVCLPSGDFTCQWRKYLAPTGFINVSYLTENEVCWKFEYHTTKRPNIDFRKKLALDFIKKTVSQLEEKDFPTLLIKYIYNYRVLPLGKNELWITYTTIKGNSYRF